MSDRACFRCQGQGGYLQPSALDPDDVDWDICLTCDGKGTLP